MLVEVELPRLGESITEATILAFPKKLGEYVEEGETIAEIATDKVDSEVPAPCAGVIKKILAAPDDIVPIGQVVLIIDSEASDQRHQPSKDDTPEKIDTELDTNNPIPSTDQSSSTTTIQQRSIAEGDASSQQEVFLSPLVLSIAKKENLTMHEIRSIQGSGANGRIRKSDIHRYLKNRKYPLQEGAPTPSQGKVHFNNPFSDFQPPTVAFESGVDRMEPMDRMREMIAGHMVYSMQTAPHVTCYAEVDLTTAVMWRNSVKQDFLDKYGYKLTLTPIFLESIAKSIQEFPMINVSLKDKQIVFKKDINIGMATAIPSGHLIVPVIRHTDEKNLLGLAKEVSVLSDKARTNRLDPSDVRGGTFTLSNVGTFGSLTGTPIINQPQSAILATGIIKKRPEVMTYDGEDRIEIRHMMIMALSFDHRVIDGYLGGSFLKRVADNLEAFDPKRLI